jgi:hypothetical protein
MSIAQAAYYPDDEIQPSWSDRLASVDDPDFRHGSRVEDGTCLFRYVDYGYAVRCHEYDISKATPKGYWITVSHRERFVLQPRGGEARYAYPTRKEAWNSYRIRKNRQRGYLENTLERITKILEQLDGNEPVA